MYKVVGHADRGRPYRYVVTGSLWIRIIHVGAQYYSWVNLLDGLAKAWAVAQGLSNFDQKG